MSFDTPEFLFLLVLVIPLVLAVFIHRKRRGKGAAFIAASAGGREAVKAAILFRIALSDVFFILFTVFMIIGLAGPRWGTRLIADSRRGLDVVLAFDISRSMNVRDCPPLPEAGENSSRLERALAAARELCFLLEDVRFAAAVGKGRGVLMVPLTWDTESLFGFFDSLDDSVLTGAGTNLESLVDSAVGAFRDSLNRQKGIIVFSDGEIHQGALETALDHAREAGIVVSAAGFGTSGPVPVEKNDKAPDGFLLAPDKSMVISARREDFLKEIAEISGGIYTDGNLRTAAALLADFYKPLSHESVAGYHREQAKRWQFFVFFALACLLLSRLVGLKRRKRAVFGLFCVFSLLAVSCAPVQGKLLILEGNFHYSRQNYNNAISSYMRAMDFEETAPYAEYGLGLCYSALGEQDAALERYAEAAALPDSNSGRYPELAYRISFNTGIIHFEQGNFPLAAESFRKALETDSSRLDAKRNLELSLMSLANHEREGTANRSESGEEARGESEDSGSQRLDALERTQALFDFLRDREHEQWRSEWKEESNSVWPDY